MYHLVLIAAPPQASADQTAGALLLLHFANVVKRGNDKEAEALLTPGAFIGDYWQSERTSFSDFATYARGCKLSDVTLAPIAAKRMRIGMHWSCRYPEANRDASFWFEGKRIAASVGVNCLSL
jgi:hypothetical protein